MFDPMCAANIWAEDKARRLGYHRESKNKVTPPLLVEESLLDPPCPSTADLSSGDEDDCDDVYSCSDESSGENDD